MSDPMSDAAASESAVPTPVVRSARDLVPRIHHAGMPLKLAQKIQTEIAHAHVFVPILTAHSHKAGWVHQEIGYALALVGVVVANVATGGPSVGPPSP